MGLGGVESEPNYCDGDWAKVPHHLSLPALGRKKTKLTRLTTRLQQPFFVVVLVTFLILHCDPNRNDISSPRTLCKTQVLHSVAANS